MKRPQNRTRNKDHLRHIVLLEFAGWQPGKGRKYWEGEKNGTLKGYLGRAG